MQLQAILSHSNIEIDQPPVEFSWLNINGEMLVRFCIFCYDISARERRRKEVLL